MTVQRPVRKQIFHSGELALQIVAGRAQRLAELGGKIIRDFMPQQHRDFYAQLPFIVVAIVDDRHDVWPTLWAGNPGFISSPDETTLQIDHTLLVDDPASRGVAAGAAIGLLGIELHTRRRNRMNGMIMHCENGQMQIHVDQAYGNCPRFIQKRDWHFAPHGDGNMKADATKIPAIESGQLSPRARAMIAQADTFFVGSYADQDDLRQVDVSHRGGRPGFVHIGADDVLTIPDFSGNFYFNTLGNFVVNPRAGLLFVDFESGDMLHLAGTARLVTDSTQIPPYDGAERFWTFQPERVVLRKGACPLRWQMQADGFSPATLKTGLWPDLEHRIERKM